MFNSWQHLEVFRIDERTVGQLSPSAGRYIKEIYIGVKGEKVTSMCSFLKNIKVQLAF